MHYKIPGQMVKYAAKKSKKGEDCLRDPEEIAMADETSKWKNILNLVSFDSIHLKNE